MKEITECRACKSGDLVEFLALGQQYLSDFRKNQSRPPKYPLVVVICGSCKLVQLKHATPQAEMYHERYGFKSSVSDSIKDDLKDVVRHAFTYKNNPGCWMEIASNDGYTLSQIPAIVFKVGVDPVKFLCEEAKPYADLVINDYFTQEALQSYNLPLFDVITSISCFYDMPDPSKFVADVEKALAYDGIWIIQQNYLLTTMQLGAIDNVCHEHLEYYTLLSLENLLVRFGLEINEVVLSPINGGSIRTVVSHKDTFPIHDSVERQRQIEREAGLDKIEPYKEFVAKANANLKELRNLVTDLKEQGRTIAILAASTRGATIWQSAGIGPGLVDYAIERNPTKVGKWFSAIGVPIISEEEGRKRNPDVMLVGPWFNEPELRVREAEYLKNGGTLLFPLPEVKLVCG